MAKPGYRLALFATALALLVVLLGAYTRLTHAGLGCPDWPGCYGFIGVPQSAEQLAHAEQHYPQAPVEAHKGWNEMVHRYFAGSLGLLILAPGGYRTPARRLRDLEFAAVTDFAAVRPLARFARVECSPASPGGVVPVAGDRSEGPRRLGQQQLCGGGLYRSADLPWPVVAGDGFCQRLSPDSAHRPQLPRRSARQRCAYRHSHDSPPRRRAGDPGAAALGLAAQAPWPGSPGCAVAAGAGRADQPGHPQRAVAGATGR